MKCPQCDGKLKVTHTYRAGQSGKTQRSVCSSCGRKFTLLLLIQCESDGHGKGAYALAKKLEKSSEPDQVVVDLEQDQEQEKA